MLWKESMSEGVTSGSLGLAARRRGLGAADDILAAADRGRGTVSWRIGEGGHLVGVSSRICVHRTVTHVSIGMQRPSKTGLDGGVGRYTAARAGGMARPRGDEWLLWSRRPEVEFDGYLVVEWSCEGKTGLREDQARGRAVACRSLDGRRSPRYQRGCLELEVPQA